MVLARFMIKLDLVPFYTKFYCQDRACPICDENDLTQLSYKGLRTGPCLLDSLSIYTYVNSIRRVFFNRAKFVLFAN